MKKIFILCTLILHFVYQAKSQSNSQFEKVYQTNWYSRLSFFQVSENKILLYDVSNYKLSVIDSLGNSDSLFTFSPFLGGNVLSPILKSNVDSGNIYLSDVEMCDLIPHGYARIEKRNPQGGISWSIDSLNNSYSSSAIAKYANGYLFSSIKYTYNAQSYPVQLARINEAGQIHFYPEIATYAATENMLVANNKILIPILDTLNNSNYALFDTLGNYSIIPTFPINTQKECIASDSVNLYVANNSVLKLLNGNFVTTAQFNLSNISDYGTSLQLIKNDSIIWLLSKNTQNKYRLYKFSASLIFLDSVVLENYISSKVIISKIFFVGNRLIVSGRNVTHQNSQPFLKSFDKYSLQTINNINQPIITNLSISNIGGQVNYLYPTAPYSVYFHFDVTATVKNNGTTTLHSLILNAPENGLSIGWGFCQEINICQRFDNLNILPGDSVNLTLTYSSSRYSWTGSFLFSNFYLWCSAPNDELNSADNSTDTVKTNILITNLLGVGIDEKTSADVLQIYPNPFTESTNVSLKNLSPENVKCKLQNVTGKVIEEFTISPKEEYHINSNLQCGIYFLTYTNQSGIHKSAKLIKQ